MLGQSAQEAMNYENIKTPNSYLVPENVNYRLNLLKIYRRGGGGPGFKSVNSCCVYTFIYHTSSLCSLVQYYLMMDMCRCCECTWSQVFVLNARHGVPSRPINFKIAHSSSYTSQMCYLAPKFIKFREFSYTSQRCYRSQGSKSSHPIHSKIQRIFVEHPNDKDILVSVGTSGRACKPRL